DLVPHVHRGEQADPGAGQPQFAGYLGGVGVRIGVVVVAVHGGVEHPGALAQATTVRSRGNRQPRGAAPPHQQRPAADVGQRGFGEVHELRALTTRDGLGRPGSSAIHTLVSSNLSTSTPCSIPSPSSIQTRSSVARLPVADFAYGQPPRPPAEESTVDTPWRSAA